jgi:glutathione synthase/RimK-type ligase-like ATP-grasp enzyme
MVFEGARWVNHPGQVYIAEHKAIQLHAARQVGFRIPETTIANSPRYLPSVPGQVAVKGIDAILYAEGEREFFGYTQLVERSTLSDENLAALPTVVQAAVVPKLDLRVTVVGNEMWCAEIHGRTGPITGDWRELKDAVTYRPRGVSEDLRQRVLALMDRLGLVYGAVDLAEQEGEIYFLEVNPTGEWAWLERELGFPVSKALCRLLSGDRR